ncbi:MAG: DUF4105 domain-containing protein [Tannerella sp.]|jgi:hypothetical protein|nr:DUF4105 domain-containing protein [Tannerella sp.]
MKENCKVKILPLVLSVMIMAVFEAGAKVSEGLAAKSLGKGAQISLLTCSPSDDDVYTLYGHTAIRVLDSENKLDAVFNYGIFDYTKPNFIYRFAKGETDYKLRAYPFDYFFSEYETREVCEQILNLLPAEKEALWQALVENERPENRVYRYSFFFDNCATRPAIMIEKNIAGEVKYLLEPDNKTFRDVINYCTRNHPWQTFGCDLALGLPTDRVMSHREAFFLPQRLREEFAGAIIVRKSEGLNAGEASETGEASPAAASEASAASYSAEPLVKKTKILAEESNDEIDNAASRFDMTPSPMTASILLFLIILLITGMEWRRKTYCRAVDCLLFFVAGLAGCVLFFLSFISVHASIFPNMSLLWLHPLHLLGVVFFAVKKLKHAAICYHFINFAAILGMSAAWFFVPQHFNFAFAPLIACLVLRSATRLLRSAIRQKKAGVKIFSPRINL